MKYISTRGSSAAKSFTTILLEGLAADGGLYLPQQYPQITADQLDSWRNLNYCDLAYEIFNLFIDDISSADLKQLLAQAYNSTNFGSDEIVPLKQVNNQCFLLGLSNGPTLAFKDIAMQMLGQLFEYELNRRGQQLNILAATSGDTGSAAEYAMRGKKNIRVFMTSSAGRMSPFQQAQMFSLQDANIFNLAIEGVFDDCQDLVKQIFADSDFKRHYSLGAVNSINWARILAQIVYYFWGYLKVSNHSSEKVSFTVPTGNFGNICAAHIAHMMGLPVSKLVVAVNENDVLHEFFQSGIYRPRPAADTCATSSPSMDISKASNLERFVFDLLERNSSSVNQLFTQQLTTKGYFDIGQYVPLATIADKYRFFSGKSNHQLRISNIRQLYQKYNLLIDPHTADAWQVAQQHLEPNIKMLVLETAQPVKFAATIQEALGLVPPYPPHLANLESLPRRVKQLPADAELVKNYLRHNID